MTLIARRRFGLKNITIRELVKPARIGRPRSCAVLQDSSPLLQVPDDTASGQRGHPVSFLLAGAAILLEGLADYACTARAASTCSTKLSSRQHVRRHRPVIHVGDETIALIHSCRMCLANLFDYCCAFFALGSTRY
jgi:hypothetical protein